MRELANAQIAGLSADWKPNIAYNAALQAAAASLPAGKAAVKVWRGGPAAKMSWLELAQWYFWRIPAHVDQKLPAT